MTIKFNFPQYFSHIFLSKNKIRLYVEEAKSTDVPPDRSEGADGGRGAEPPEGCRAKPLTKKRNRRVQSGSLCGDMG